MRKTIMAISVFHAMSLLTMEPRPRAISVPDDELCEVVITSYFRHDEVREVHSLRPYLQQVISEAHDSPLPARREGLDLLRRVKSGEVPPQTLKEQNLEPLKDMVTAATARALEDQRREIERRWTKKKSTCCATITGIASTALTATVALIIHYTKGKCS